MSSLLHIGFTEQLNSWLSGEQQPGVMAEQHLWRCGYHCQTTPEILPFSLQLWEAHTSTKPSQTQGLLCHWLTQKILAILTGRDQDSKESIKYGKQGNQKLPLHSMLW